jgi:CRISPR/Cas system-associated endonuclease Cas1
MCVKQLQATLNVPLEKVDHLVIVSGLGFSGSAIQQLA